MPYKRFFTAAACSLFLLTSSFSPPAHAKLEQNHIALSIGHYDVLGDEEAADFRLEFRSAYEFIKNLHPWFGGEVTTDGAAYALAGILYDVEVIDNWFFTPSFGAGFYSDGSGKDLGHGVEFRSQLELSYEFEAGHRFGVSFSHISNAGLGNENPGTEVFALTYSIPLDWFLK